jgi:hypothetical protein
MSPFVVAVGMLACFVLFDRTSTLRSVFSAVKCARAVALEKKTWKSPSPLE